MSLENTVRTAFVEQFGEAPATIVRAPGRVNLIGEHTDYNDGFVMPMAIDRAVWIALRPRADSIMAVHSIDYHESREVSLTNLNREPASWIEYMKGMAWALQLAGHPLKGWEGVVIGDVPRGAGLSSSAAIEMATARAFSEVSHLPWDAAKMAKLGQRAENEWLGVKTGIMDQMISAAGEEGCALLIDCRSLETQSVPLPMGLSVVVLDTATRRGLVDSKYNERREQCERAAAFFGAKALRDVTIDQLEGAKDKLEPLVYRRARHVITENARTLAAADAMRTNNIPELGRLIDASHVSMRDDFEITNDALNIMVECARQHPACIGARMTGGGFGGCAIAIVPTSAAEEFGQTVSKAYHERTNLAPMIYVCSPSQGASVVA